jgi:hypothetical protein
MANPSRALGSAPEAFNGKAKKAENFWASLETYYHLNENQYDTDLKKIAAALTFCQVGTSAGAWAQEQHKEAFKHSPPQFGTWRDFKKAFANHFIPAESVLESTQKMHNLHMNNREFNNWYQEWSTHATRSGADDATKMYAFRRMLPHPLHAKIIGVTPQPATLTELVTKACKFNRLWRIYERPASTRGGNPPGKSRYNA